MRAGRAADLAQAHWRYTELMATRTLLTLEQFAQLPDDDQLYELDEGELITMAPAGGMHGRTENRIGYLLNRYLEGRQLGEVLPSDTGFVLRRNPDVVRSPDVAVPRDPT